MLSGLRYNWLEIKHQEKQLCQEPIFKKVLGGYKSSINKNDENISLGPSVVQKATAAVADAMLGPDGKNKDKSRQILDLVQGNSTYAKVLNKKCMKITNVPYAAVRANTALMLSGIDKVDAKFSTKPESSMPAKAAKAAVVVCKLPALAATYGLAKGGDFTYFATKKAVEKGSEVVEQIRSTLRP